MLLIFLVMLSGIVGCLEDKCPGEDFSIAPRPYKKPKNIPVCEKPYRGPNCTCPSSMFECACHKFGQCGDKPGCIKMSKVNNWGNDCEDWSDELSDICPTGSFQCDCFNTTCKGRRSCIPEDRRCDKEIDCLDGSDEVNCSCPDDKFECDCYKTSNCTSSFFFAGCLPKTKQCNGMDDCGDWSDELDCPCPADQFNCNCYKTNNCELGKNCINKNQLCDGSNDCGDWIDEVNCTCPVDHFECDCYRTNNCTNRHYCVRKDLLCDGNDDCGDWSDEVNCTCPDHKFECECYKTNSCKIGTGCIKNSWHCDGNDDCGDWSDEANCTCPDHKFECDCYQTKNCKNGLGCFTKEWQCNKINECGDGSDEMNCTCPAHLFECACVGTKRCIGMEGSCIDRSLLCDGNRDCFDGTDETHRTCNCSGVYARCPCDPSNKHCPSTGRCIPFDWLGDEVEDCSDRSDELCSFSNFTCQSCAMFATTCKSEQLARYLVYSTVPAECNTVMQPSCADDINNCVTSKVTCVLTACETPEQYCWDIFVCENEQVTNVNDFCNLINGCSDNSDEIVNGFGFKCSGPSRQGVCVLPQVNVYDSVAECSDKSDLCFVNGQFRCFQCLDKKLIISPKQVCDGIVDCFDMSDECLCLNQSLCNDISGACPRKKMHCQNEYDCSDLSGKLCNSSVHCVDQINTKYCSSLKEKGQRQCSANNEGFGIENILSSRKHNKMLRPWYEYISGFDVDTNKVLCSICNGVIWDVMWLPGELDCPDMFFCFSSGEINIKGTQVCDGTIDCYDGSDEFVELCNNTRYYCKTKDKVSIQKNSVCDGMIDCDDKSDESRCRCESKRFYCRNKQPLSVDLKLVQNGIQDCSDGSDECVNLIDNPFADVNEMIANAIYRVIFWITAVLALGGNLFVLIAITYSLWTVNKNQNGFINTSVFIINLCCSDLLMGIYLLAIIVQGTQFSGSYCLFDKEWRSSGLCSGLGALAIVASEASAFTMTAMTTFRLLATFNPLLHRTTRVRTIVLVELVCWLSAVVLAIVPLLQVSSEYFANGVWFPNHFFENDFVSRKNMSLLATRIKRKEPEGWNDVIQTIKEAFPRSPIKGGFGYYGETSVCLPRLFVTTNEFAWEYSTFLITINFLMFIYMVVAYVLIYKQSNRMKGSRNTDISSSMQKRISRLIVTDFCCWIPICIMGYLNLGGIKMPPDAYVLSACLLLPINSALNPLIYSKSIQDHLNKAKNSVKDKLSSLRESMIRSSDFTVRYEAGGATESDRVIEIVK